MTEHTLNVDVARQYIRILKPDADSASDDISIDIGGPRDIATLWYKAVGVENVSYRYPEDYTAMYGLAKSMRHLFHLMNHAEREFLKIFVARADVVCVYSTPVPISPVYRGMFVTMIETCNVKLTLNCFYWLYQYASSHITVFKGFFPMGAEETVVFNEFTLGVINKKGVNILEEDMDVDWKLHGKRVKHVLYIIDRYRRFLTDVVKFMGTDLSGDKMCGDDINSNPMGRCFLMPSDPLHLGECTDTSIIIGVHETKRAFRVKE